jgi:hypothetical protein
VYRGGTARLKPSRSLDGDLVRDHLRAGTRLK